MKARSGMTLVEVVVAMLILTGVVLVLGAFSAKFAQASSQARLVIAANELAARRLDAVRTQPTYSAIDTMAHADTVKSDFTSYVVSTVVRHVGGGAKDSVDYRFVTVNVTQPAMKKVVSKTTAMAAF